MQSKIRVTARMAAVAAALTVLASGAAAGGPVTPAWAGGSPVRVAQPSSHDATQTKLVSVACPGTGQSVYAPGVRVIGGGGAVVITAMVPDPTLTSVTVAATARTGYTGKWSLVAYAVCYTSVHPPGRVDASAAGASTVTATCPGTSRLTGLGFRIDDADRGAYLAEAAPDAGLRQVRVRTRGVPDSLAAYGICRPPAGPAGSRLQATAAVAPTGTTVSVAEQSQQRTIYGAGAAVSGPGATLLSAIVPDLAGNRALAEAVPAGAAGARSAVQSDDADEDEVTVYGTFIGTFH